MQCLSCKNRHSIERCDKQVLRGFLVCGIHARLRLPRIWIEHNDRAKWGITKVQALWRGHMMRYRLLLAGPGVLKRALCHNEEEMVTFEGKHEISPFDYISFEEGGKIWWFDQRTMIEWSRKNLDIQNPFTRTTLSPDDVGRIRKLFVIRKKRGQPVVHNEEMHPLLYIRDERWLRVVQAMYECGFGGMIHPEYLISFGPYFLRMMMGLLVDDTRWWMYEIADGRDPYTLHSKRAKIHTWIKTMRCTMHTYTSPVHLSRDVAGVLLGCINELGDPTEFVFFILSAVLKLRLATVL